MTWFKVDDKAAFHKKVVKAGNEAFGALVRMGSWCCDHLTDGRIPIETAAIIANEQTLQKLCYVGFLEPDGDEFVIHDFLEYNPSAAEVEAERQRKRELGKKGAEARWNGRNSKSNSGSHAASHGGPHRHGIGSSNAPDPDPLKENSLAGAWNKTAFSTVWVDCTKKTPTGDWTKLDEAAERCASSAKTRGVPDVTAHAQRLLQSFVAVVDGWKASGRPAPQKSVEAFLRNFTACEEVVDGERDPKGPANAVGQTGKPKPGTAGMALAKLVNSAREKGGQ